MKKNTIIALYNYLTSVATDLDTEVITDVTNEYERQTAASGTKSALYDAAWEVVKNVLGDGLPHTAKEIFAASEDYPEDFTIAKLQYGLRQPWKDYVIKSDNGNGPKSYTLV